MIQVALSVVIADAWNAAMIRFLWFHKLSTHTVKNSTLILAAIQNTINMMQKIEFVTLKIQTKIIARIMELIIARSVFQKKVNRLLVNVCFVITLNWYSDMEAVLKNVYKAMKILMDNVSLKRLIVKNYQRRHIIRNIQLGKILLIAIVTEL